jgi:aryl-alcohol dehydrogenase-like predicted oxidoreductase/adenylate kinase family enzyme
MRLPADERHALETIAAALDAGVTVFDTARAYPGNERLVATAVRDSTARIVTKGGMSRVGDGWVPDGRAKAILADCEASLEALGGLPIDLYLIHAPDQRTPWRTSVRALARIADEGMANRIGLANVNRSQLDEALELAPVAAVQVALSPYDDNALRGGIVERCEELGLTVIAHSPLGGPRRAHRLARIDTVAAIAVRHEVTPAEAALAWLLELSPAIVAIPGATRPETARSAASAGAITLDEDERAAPRPKAAGHTREDGEVVLVMGIPGAGKSRIAEDYVARGYLRLNRDERGGSLRELATALDEELARGEAQIVLDNTYLTRAVRSYVLEAAQRHGLAARCVWLDTPLAQAQVNLVERLLDRFGALPSSEELREVARREQGFLMPTSQMRTMRELEPPSLDEGWASVEHLEFERVSTHDAGRPGVFIAAGATTEPGWEQPDTDAPHLVFDWNPDGDRTALDTAVARVAARVAGPVEAALCPHPAGPPSCWCRPPLPGLPLAFVRAHELDLSRSTVVGTGPAHRTLATALGVRYSGP